MSQNILPRAGILAFMDDESRAQFSAYGNLINTVPGEVLIREGESQTRLYIVISGSFNITATVQGHEVHIDVVPEGDCLGEVSVFQPGVASATVTSNGPGQLWFIEVQIFNNFFMTGLMPAAPPSLASIQF